MLIEELRDALQGATDLLNDSEVGHHIRVKLGEASRWNKIDATSKRVLRKTADAIQAVHNITGGRQ